MSRIHGILFAAFLASAGCSDQHADAGGALPAGGGYDFLVLSLSWSPTYCLIEGERANRGQCGSDERHGFIVHGLWPQFERGWPEFCDSGEPARVPDALVRDMLDLMPSASLIGHQWRKHGSCTGLAQRDYFRLVRAARERIAIPDALDDAERTRTLSPRAVGEAFIDANAGLGAQGIAVTCEGRLVEEVRICLTKDLQFRDCREVAARACRLPSAELPAAPS